jgi:hypothetical protein
LVHVIEHEKVTLEHLFARQEISCFWGKNKLQSTFVTESRSKAAMFKNVNKFLNKRQNLDLLAWPKSLSKIVLYYVIGFENGISVYLKNLKREVYYAHWVSIDFEQHLFNHIFSRIYMPT